MAQTQNMIKFILKRILLMIPSVFIVLTATFIISRMMAGDPTMYLLPWDTPEEEREALLTEMGFFEPWYVQLGKYYVNFFTGDLGNSMVVASTAEGNPMPVNQVIAQRFPATLELMFIPMVLVPILGVKMGVTSAVNRNKFASSEGL